MSCATRKREATAKDLQALRRKLRRSPRNIDAHLAFADGALELQLILPKTESLYALEAVRLSALAVKILATPGTKPYLHAELLLAVVAHFCCDYSAALSRFEAIIPGLVGLGAESLLHQALGYATAASLALGDEERAKGHLQRLGSVKK